MTTVLGGSQVHFREATLDRSRSKRHAWPRPVADPSRRVGGRWPAFSEKLGTHRPAFIGTLRVVIVHPRQHDHLAGRVVAKRTSGTAGRGGAEPMLVGVAERVCLGGIPSASGLAG